MKGRVRRITGQVPLRRLRRLALREPRRTVMVIQNLGAPRFGTRITLCAIESYRYKPESADRTDVMARYKVLKSVAHNIVHSFASDMNWRDGDYVLSHLLKRMLESGTNSLTVDLLTGRGAPEIVLTAPVRASIGNFVTRFTELVHSHQSSMSFVQAAEMTLTFDFDRGRPMVAPSSVEYPFIGIGRITDDRGRVWSGEVTDWWSPDAGEPVMLPSGEPASRGWPLWQHIRSLWIRGHGGREG